MMAAFTLRLLAVMLALVVLAGSAGVGSAQTPPGAGRSGEAAPTQRAQPAERLPGPQRSEEQRPREDGPAVEDRAPSMPGCQDQGRKLELIV
jgi:hypothetical protein